MLPTTSLSPVRGIALLLLSQLLLVAMDATAKHLSQTFPVLLLVWARYTVHCALMVVFFLPSQCRALFATKQLGVQIIRALLLLATSACGLIALRVLPLAETAGLAFVSPLLATILAGPWLGEKVGRAGWFAIFLGALGALLISHPGGHLPFGAILLVLASALSFSIYQILTRQLSRTESTSTMLFYTALGGAVCMNLALPWFWGGPVPSWQQALQIASLGIYGGVGHLLVIQAFRNAPVSTLTPFMYVQLIWATLLGWLFFGHFPDSLSITGMVVIVASGLLLSYARGIFQSSERVVNHHAADRTSALPRTQDALENTGSNP